jgi:hypothetical protein
MQDRDHDKLLATKANFHEQAMAIPGVHATSLGFKRVAGEQTKQVAICVHVVQKRALNELPAEERIPAQIDGFATDVVETGAPMESGAKYRPLVGGSELGVRCNGFYFGTLGCVVVDPTTKTLYALSCAHVLKDLDSATFQPASYTVTDEIGATKTTANDSLVDCGISTVSYYSDGGKPEILGIGKVRGSRRVTIDDVGKRMMKYGNTTHLTIGVLEHVNLSGTKPDGTKYQDQFTVAGPGNFADIGDSGSVIVDENFMVVGLLWAVYTYQQDRLGAMANQIDNVLAKLGVQVLTYYTASTSKSVSDLEQVSIEALFSQSPRAEQYWQTFLEHRDKLQQLLMRTPRLYAMWLEMPQHELLDALRQGAKNPASSIPTSIGGRETALLLRQLYVAFARHLEQPRARRQLDAFYRDVTGNIGASWSVALGDAPTGQARAAE